MAEELLDPARLARVLGRVQPHLGEQAAQLLLAHLVRVRVGVRGRVRVGVRVRVSSVIRASSLSLPRVSSVASTRSA